MLGTVSMAKSKGDPPKGTDLTTRVLLSIRDEIQRLGDRMETGFAAVNDRLDQTNARLDNLRDIAGDTIRELEARIRILEARVLG